MRLRHLGSSLVVEAPAKLNLFLEVLGRREDGYHNLDTVMIAVDVFDTLRFSNTDHPAIRLDVSFDPRTQASQLAHVPVDDRNICVKAARLLQRDFGVKQGAFIELRKRIPTQAGMGGGSSDAAATLVALNQLWNLQLTSAELHTLAAQLGSDVNFFIDSPTLAVCKGRGEQVEKLTDCPELNFVVALPTDGLSTAAVFGALVHDRRVERVETFINRLASAHAPSIGEAMFNRLEMPATELDPQVAELLNLMRSSSRLPPRMTGSGSACFALCGGRGEARQLAARLRSRHNGPVWVCKSCITMGAV